MRNKYKKITAKDIKGTYDFKLDINDTVPYEYFFKKIGGKVYRFYKIGNEDWKSEETSYFEEPFIYFSSANSLNKK